MADQLLMADPEMIPSIVSQRDAERVQAAIREGFGFEPTLAYCAALVAFVDAQEFYILDLKRMAQYGPEDLEAMLAGVGA